MVVRTVRRIFYNLIFNELDYNSDFLILTCAMAMGLAFQITRQDFQAARSAFISRNYELMNILANRLMTNAVLGKHAERECAVPGFFLKEIALNAGNCPPEGSGNERILRSGERFIRVLDQAFKETPDLETMWSGYAVFVDGVRSAGKHEVEAKAYKDVPEFTGGVIDYLINDLLSIEEVCQENSRILTGMLSEVNRLVLSHGAQQSDLVSWCLLRAVERLHTYHVFSCIGHGQWDVQVLKARSEPYVVRLKECYQGVFKQKGLTKEATDFLCDLILQWRVAFIRYLEGNHPTGVKERREVELPQDAKQKITETISEILTKNLTPTGQKKPN